MYRSCAQALQTRVGGASGDAAVAMLGNRMAALLSAPPRARARVARGMWAEAPARLRGLAECGRCPEAWAAVRAAAALGHSFNPVSMGWAGQFTGKVTDA
jgi:hypothetical protein